MKKIEKIVAALLALSALAFAACDAKISEKSAEIPGWDLVFQDEFDEFNAENWSYQNWEPGTVNAELQKYTDSEKNVYVKNGALVIQALKDDGGRYKYTSGRLISFQKNEFKYGRFEARIKVPSGRGFLPAFWLMGNESGYGQWPRCGEIDIMEVMGHDTKTLYTTIHYGSDISRDARQGQGVTSGETDFAKDFHVYACEWDPGEIRFYIDDSLIHTENRWYTARSYNGKRQPYPAPFDRKMYMILNLAVGGSWVGNPDESTKFGKNARMLVDYVRVYQRQGGYDEMEANCVEPEATFKPKRSEEGNIILDIAEKNFGSGAGQWRYLQAQGGDGNASVKNGAICVETKNAGSVDYSVQVVQGEIPLRKGSSYTFSFDARADEARKISAAFKEQVAWTAFFQQTVNLTTEKQHFEYTFTVNGDGDDNARLEYNFGAFGSTAAVYIENVKLIRAEGFIPG